VERLTTKDRIERVKDRIGPIVAREGYELVDLEMVSERGLKIVRLYIDTVPPGTKERGVTVDDCSRVSRVIGDVLDVEELVEGRYHLEVSSPGLFRPLTKPEHFDRAIGAHIKVKTFDKQDGRRVFTGILKGREKEKLLIEVDGAPLSVDLDKIAKANLEPEL
jgi:ribosome maturation factor RimP